MADKNEGLMCCCEWEDKIDIKSRNLTEEDKETLRNCFLNNAPYWTILLFLFIFSSGSTTITPNEVYDKIELPEDKRPHVPFLDDFLKMREMTEEEQKIYLENLKNRSKELDKERTDSDENLS